jgi:hypothetical protein
MKGMRFSLLAKFDVERDTSAQEHNRFSQISDVFQCDAPSVFDCQYLYIEMA